MIWLYSGTPGSGKSYHAVYKIFYRLKKKKFNRVIANFELNFPGDLDKNLTYWDNSEVTIDKLIEFDKKNHVPMIEGQTLVVLDEAQILFNCRDWGTNSKLRMSWIKFFSQHRKYHFNFILICQFDKMIDKQIRSLVEYEVSHMKINNFFWFLPFSYFLCIERWYGQRMKISHEIIRYTKKISNFYNSYKTFDDKKIDDKTSELEQRSESEECSNLLVSI